MIHARRLIGPARQPGSSRIHPTVLVLGIVVAALLSGLMATTAHAQVAGGTFTPDQAAGTDLTGITAVTDGTCSVPGTAETPVDGYNAVVTGPGVFAPDATEGAPDGVAIVATDSAGFSTIDPIRFSFRATFRELAQERNAALLPGDYVVTFRCVNQLFGTVFQTYSATFTLTGDPQATAFAVTNPPLAQPVSNPPTPAGGVTSSPGAPAAAATPAPAAGTSSPGGQNPWGIGVLAAIVAAAVVLATRYRKSRRRSPDRR